MDAVLRAEGGVPPEGGQREESKRLRRSMGRAFAKTYMRYFSLTNRSDVG